ncbi:FAD-dependent monooxygenase [Nocardioides sp. SYSU DS0651]|uniref:FAD-dependent monooxygenase n=1 Tax=Nocardioides sp. SYSU DS0651 TaxID=3415955 RepID=UPI003F4B27D8
MVDVAVVGGGPSGMVLAAELALADVDVVVLERRATPEIVGSRAGGFHARTIEVLDQRGVAGRFLAEGQTVQVLTFGSTVLDISDFPTRHPYTLGLWQNHIERILRGWIDELGVPVRHGCEVAGLAQDGTGVDLRLADDGGVGGGIRAAYVVGADGGRSTVRKAAGIDFPGLPPSRTNLIAEVELADEFPAGIRHDERGLHGLSLMEDGRTVRVMLSEGEVGPAREPELADLRAALREVYGSDFGAHSPTWISRFSDATRQAAAYRSDRVLLVGDAAHIHYPAGGQGIGLGVQDAVNLGWKLAQVVGGVSPPELLDSYHAERHPATERSLRFTMALSVLQRSDPRVDALRSVVDEVLPLSEPRAHLAGLATGLDVHYDLGEGHPLLGRRVPDLDLVTADGAIRVYELLHRARGVLLDLGGAGTVGPGPWADRVDHVRASYDGAWELPVIGEVAPPTAVLVRPDGHVAWVGDGSPDGLEDSLSRWFGPRRAPGAA